MRRFLLLWVYYGVIFAYGQDLPVERRSAAVLNECSGGLGPGVGLAMRGVGLAYGARLDSRGKLVPQGARLAALGTGLDSRSPELARKVGLATREAGLAQGAGLAMPDTIGAYPLLVTERYTTNLLFPSPIFKVDIGTADVLARKMGKTENVLLLKADRRGMASTNVSVYLADGRFFSFEVRYADSLSTFNYSFCQSVPRAIYTGALVGQERLDSDAVAVVAARGRLRAHGSDGGMRLRLCGLYLADGLLWVKCMGHNGSMIDFTREEIWVSVEDRKRVRRTAVQSIAVDPVFVRGGDFLAGGRSMHMVVAMRPVIIGKGKRLVVEWKEAGDGRRVKLVVKGKWVLRARRIAHGRDAVVGGGLSGE